MTGSAKRKILPFILFGVSALGYGIVCYGEEERYTGENHTLTLARGPEPPGSSSGLSFHIEPIEFLEQKRYRILTEHYDIISACRETGISAGTQLSHLFQAGHLLFAEHFEMPKRPDSPDTDSPDRHRVIIYRDKQEYAAELLPVEPSIRLTNGLYFAPKKTIYLYEAAPKNLYHEGTHQIFLEYFFKETAPTFRNNFWAVEGIALFMETLTIQEKYYQAGNVLADRLFAAKKYHFERNYRMPIRQLASMGAIEVQSSAERQQIYSQSAAIVHWLLFAEGGKHRNALFELIRQVYLGTSTPTSLSELTGLSFDELDKKYAEFLALIPD